MENDIKKVKRGTSFYDWSQMEDNVHGKQLMNEWNRDRNIFELRTNSKRTSFGTNKEVWWTCSKCHRDFKAAVCKRVHHNLGCPYCKKREGGTSVPEQVLYKIIKTLYPSTILHDKSLGFEIDIFIPELNLGIEYNGHYYHKVLCDLSERDRMKVRVCNENGIKLVQVWDDGNSEDPELDTDGYTITYKYRANKLYDQMFKVGVLIVNNIINISDEEATTEGINVIAS